ncbi:MAG: penicillin acylase family protein [Dehalococcoidia bacterium]
MKSKKGKVFIILLSIVLVLVIVAAIAVQVLFKLPQPSYSGTEKLDGLVASVEVRTDEHGIPHIFAQNETDLFFAQGYITARERMFQMDMTRLAGRGELSSVLGETMIDTDKFFKTVGFYRTAEAEYSGLQPGAKSIVDAYSSGVNAYISRAKYLPSEYTILGFKPQTWKPQDTMVCGILMAYSLNRSKDTELILNQIGTAAGSDILNYIIPVVPADAPTVSPADSRVPPAASSFNHPAESVAGAAPGSGGSGGIDSPFPLDFPGSNWMIFSGQRTASGKAVFTGSPDLAPTVPALFYLVHLKGGDYDVMGGSIPGVPTINVLGLNRYFAWSTTNGRGDEMDFFIEKINPADADQYMTEDGYKNFNVVEEILKIKGKDGIREEKLRIRISRHGPIISDVMPRAPANCAMMWVGLQPHLGIVEGFVALDKAKNFDEFRQALSVVRTPTLNFGYADIYGNIGYQYMASPPVRKAGDGTLPVPGDEGKYDWTGYIPFDRLPYDLNPARGYVASFNNVPKQVDYHITNYWMIERALRFDQIVQSKDKFTFDEIRNMQLDNVSSEAQNWVPLILAACSSSDDLKQQPALFKGWDCSINIKSPAATLFNAFYKYMVQNTLENKIGAKLTAELVQDYQMYIPDRLLTKIMKDNENAVFDDVTTANIRETRDDIIRKSMKDASAELSARLGQDPSKWEWGKVHQMTFKHPLGSKLSFYNLSPIPTNGDDFTINAGAWDSKNPYAMDSGGVIRIVVDMSNLDNSTIMSPPGQSGLFSSPYYSDLAQTWASGQQVATHYLSAGELTQVLTLQP